eukprot:scaffold44157_cov84-Phaeocystis_antarctica.AAC.1
MGTEPRRLRRRRSQGLHTRRRGVCDCSRKGGRAVLRARVREEAGGHLRRAERLADRRNRRGGAQGEGRHMQCIDECRLEAWLAWRPCSVPDIPRLVRFEEGRSGSVVVP